MINRATAGLASPVLILLAAAAPATPPLDAQVLSEAEAANLPVAGFEDHVAPIGRMENGVLRITLDAGPVQWRPWSADGPAILAHAFAADGQEPRVPGPLLRVSAGTPVHVTLRKLLAGDEPVEWQFIAKDGADLPPHQVRTQPAELRIHVGETYDFRWAPERVGDYLLRITTTFDRGAPAFPRDAPEPHVAEIPVRVR